MLRNRLGYCPCCHQLFRLHLDPEGRFIRCPEMIQSPARVQHTSEVEALRQAYVAVLQRRVA